MHYKSGIHENRNSIEPSTFFVYDEGPFSSLVQDVVLKCAGVPYVQVSGLEINDKLARRRIFLHRGFIECAIKPKENIQTLKT